MVNCAKCGEKIGFFERKYAHTDNKGKPIKYCEKCDSAFVESQKKKKELEKKELIKKLSNDKFISQFSKKYYALCLSLGYPFEEMVADFFNSGTGPPGLYSSIESYNKFLGILSSKKLSEFRKIIDFEELLNLNSNLKFIVCYQKKSDSGSYKTFLFVKNDLIDTFYNEKDSLSNFFEIVFDKYGDIDASILVKVMEKNARDEMGEQIKEISNNLSTKEQFFIRILDNFDAFINGNERYWFRKYMEDFLEVMKKKGIINFKSLGELKDAILNWKKKSNLKKFEDNLLSPNKLRISIEDTDSMNGFEFEDFLSKLFTNMGYKVKQTKLSGDQGADLIVEKSNKLMVVQAKCYSDKVSNKAIQEVVGSIKHYKADGGMVITNHYFTPSAIKLATSNDIRLIDRNKLKELIELYINK